MVILQEFIQKTSDSLKSRTGYFSSRVLLDADKLAKNSTRSLLIKIHRLRSAFPKNPPTAKCLS